MKLLWPFYCYPETGSPAVVALRERIGELWGIVVNVNSGPGPNERDANYVELIAWLKQQSGLRVFGYISSSYGDRPIEDCIADVKAWESLWGITSVFVDEAASSGDKIPFYQELRTVINGLCILNHGTVPDAGYLACGDLLCTSETTWANLQGDTFPEWCKQNKARLYHIIGGLPADQIALALKSSNETADYIFASNFTEPEAYERLPTYFTRLLGALKLYPDTAQPAPAPAPVTPAEEIFKISPAYQNLDATKKGDVLNFLQSWAANELASLGRPPAMTENTAVSILLETMRILGQSAGTLANLPAHAEGIMSEINRLRIEVAGSLRAVTDEQLVGEILRRLNK